MKKSLKPTLTGGIISIFISTMLYLIDFPPGIRNWQLAYMGWTRAIPFIFFTLLIWGIWKFGTMTLLYKKGGKISTLFRFILFPLFGLILGLLIEQIIPKQGVAIIFTFAALVLGILYSTIQNLRFRYCLVGAFIGFISTWILFLLFITAEAGLATLVIVYLSCIFAIIGAILGLIMYKVIKK